MTPRACKQAEKWADQRVLGELDDAGAKALDLHLQRCDRCREEQEIWQDLDHAAQTAPLETLTPLAERRLISGLTRAGDNRRGWSTRGWRIGLAGAAVGAAAVLAVLFGLRLMADPEPPAPQPAPIADAAPTPPPSPGVSGDDGTTPWLGDYAQVQVLRDDLQEAHFRMDHGYVLGEVGKNEPGVAYSVDTPEPDSTPLAATPEGASPDLGSAEVPTPAEQTAAQQAIVEGRLDDAVLLARVQVEEQPDNPQTIETLTMLAQALRLGHRYGPACDVYQELIDDYPGTVAAANSQVARGQLELGALGQPQDALTRFNLYLAGSPDGMLAAEARLGQIRSLAALDRHQAVIDAADDYLAAHPDGSALSEVLRSRSEAQQALAARDGTQDH